MGVTLSCGDLVLKKTKFSHLGSRSPGSHIFQQKLQKVPPGRDGGLTPDLIRGVGVILGSRVNNFLAKTLKV